MCKLFYEGSHELHTFTNDEEIEYVRSSPGGEKIDTFTFVLPEAFDSSIFFYQTNPFFGAFLYDTPLKKQDWDGFLLNALKVYTSSGMCLPDDGDISTLFYRNRRFVRLLEVDNPLVIPCGVNVKLSITADDVIHSWAVPSFGIKIDAIPGRVNQTVIVVLHPGVFMGQCSELCGIMHSFMPINIEAIYPDVFFEEYNFTIKSRKKDD